jgi:hypothetical protein
MNIDLIPTLIDQYRETFEGEITPGMCWITDGRPGSALLGTLDSLTADQAFAPPSPGSLPVAAHVQHLRYTLDITLDRLQGRNPTPDWPSSFHLPAQPSPQSWTALRASLRRSYDGVLSYFQQHRHRPAADWPPIHLAGLCAMTAHNAYHLGAIRQIANALRRGAT